MKKKGIYENACFQALVFSLPVYRPGIPSCSGKHMTVAIYHQQRSFYSVGCLICVYNIVEM